MPLPIATDISHDLGWCFEHSYAQLPDTFHTRLNPTPVSDPKLVICNHTLAQELGLDLSAASEDALAQLFSGNTLPNGVKPLAQAYAGHQFGHFTYLGDGRAHLLGEHRTPSGSLVDIQFKGSGQTPYSRLGDGRAALGPMLREYIISEAMHALGIPTTRSLAVVTTGDVVLRETPLQGAILTRIASSHIRVGTFEYAAAREDKEALKQLADYTIARHYPELQESDTPYQGLLDALMHRQIDLVVNWLRVGFIHGVMNTDNTTLSGETIDYGPCAFMDVYDPATVFSAIDRQGRYAYANQPNIIGWNIARFAESLLPLLHEESEKALAIAEETLKPFGKTFQTKWLAMMRTKLGLFGEEEQDEKLIGRLLKWMQANHADYTNTFRDIITETLPTADIYQGDAFKTWHGEWQARLSRNPKPLKSAFCLMNATNPARIPRNHQVEKALSAAEEWDLSVMHQLLDALKEPYKDDDIYHEFTQPPPPAERVYQTFCGT